MNVSTLPAVADVSPSPSQTAVTPLSGGPHLAYLDGLRGFAALYVMLTHVWKIWYGPYIQGGVSGFFTSWFLQGGRSAVSVFIVLSGFCLMLPVARTDGRLRGGILPFYKRRARRILPPFYAALGVSLVLTAVDAFFFEPANRALFSRQNLLANVLLLQDVLPRANAFNLPFWTVALEWKIYFLFPLYVWACRRGGIWGGAGLSVLLAGAVTALFHRIRPEATLFQTCPWHLFSFGMGVCAAWMAVGRGAGTFSRSSLEKIAWVVCGVLATSVWLVINQMPSGVAGGNLMIRLAPLTDCLTALAASSGLLALYLQLTAQKVGGKPAFFLQLLGWKPLVFVGMWAYSLYLLHYPILDLWHTVCLRFFAPLSFPVQSMIYLVGGVLLCLVAAYGFFLVGEKPFLKKTVVPAPLAPSGASDLAR